MEKHEQFLSLRSFIVGDYGKCCDKLFNTLSNDPRFNTGLSQNDLADLNLDQYRLIQYQRAKALAEYQFIENENVVECPISPAAFCDAVSFVDWSAAMKYFLNRSVCVKAKTFVYSCSSNDDVMIKILINPKIKFK